MPDEAHGVGKGELPTTRRLGLAHRWVECREQGVLDEHAGAGEPVEEAGLACVRVAGDGDGRRAGSMPRCPLGRARLLHLLELLAELGHLHANSAAIGLDLRLARAAGADAAGLAAGPAASLPRERLAPAPQPRKQVLHLRQAHLRLALPAALAELRRVW